jgi:hypothetical protein
VTQTRPHTVTLAVVLPIPHVLCYDSLHWDKQARTTHVACLLSRSGLPHVRQDLPWLELKI